MTKTAMMARMLELIRKTDGNFAMMAAILVPVVFVAGSLALDTTNALSMKTHLQNATDASALATASQLAAGTLDEADAKAYAAKFFQGLVSEDSKAFTEFSAVPTVTIVSSGSGKKTVWQVKVDAVGTQEATKFARLSGRNELKVAISGTSESALDASNPLSMMLVLDRSGSMSWGSVKETVPAYCGWGRWTYQCGTREILTGTPKMTVLKEAVGNLVDHISESDTTNEYARIGAVAYNFETVASDKFNPTWNKSGVKDFANALVAENGTYSVDAMEWAVDTVTGSGEINEHFSKNQSKNPLKFIVFMTDGEHDTGSEWKDDYADKTTKQHCQTAKDNKVTIFSVAFQAPERGQALLKACASGDDRYYDAQSADELLKAFTDIGKEAAAQVTRLTN
ncbi:MAG: TadE/TadG family type IV pilus assembly protein [Hoeflea sp.]|uniref:TadE/TadG family type IV pilus assembly protein n=1 Tax=Hoeflea sp. TaxID=1940281 RepID=UPI00329A666B